MEDKGSGPEGATEQLAARVNRPEPVFRGQCGALKTVNKLALKLGNQNDVRGKESPKPNHIYLTGVFI